MPTAIDHVIILAEDLDTAMQQYTDLGFTVIPGGKHARFTHNALVTFQDGSYLELIAFYEAPDAAKGEGHRWFKHVGNGGGLIDFAVGTPDVTSVVKDTTARGLHYDGPHPGQRARPDGEQLRWQSAMAGSEDSSALPFVIEDITDRGLRVPADGNTHTNGVRGIARLVVAADDLDAAIRDFQALLGVDAPKSKTDAGATFEVGPHTVELVAATAASGTGPVELQFIADEAGTIDPATASNANLKLVTK
ncbi:MAG: VOC family protein [Thermomicrobiales bacterium]|nr:VOC family protein [Thermomicrobiales bacterium]